MSKKEKTYLVKTPNTQFAGQRAGVFFKEGKGQATEEQAEKLVKQFGYSCPELFPDEDKGGNGKKLSKDLKPLSKAVTELNKLQSAEQVQAFTEGDDRKGVEEAVAAKLEELNGGDDDTDDESSEDEDEGGDEGDSEDKAG